MYIATICILYHDMGIVMGIPSHNIDLKKTMYVLHLGFCSMINVYRIVYSFGVGICPSSFNHGKDSKVPFHSCPKPHQVLVFKQGLGGRSKICHGRQNKVTIQFAYVPYACIFEFLEVKRGDTSTIMDSIVYKNFPSQTDVKQPTIKNHLRPTW
jgi:hypothetical protein